MKFSPEQQTLIKTLAYVTVFDFPLTLQELHQRQIASKTHPTLSIAQVKKIVIQMSILAVDQNYIYFKKYPNQVQLRQQRTVWSNQKWQEVESLKTFLKPIPFIKAAYITGSLAMNNISRPNDDIDVLIVTRQNRLWIARAILVPLAILLGKYRFHRSKSQTGWCFNLWLDESEVSLPPDRRSLYTAYEVIQAKQIVGADNVLAQANTWVNEFLPLFNLKKKPMEISLNKNIFINRLNLLVYRLQWQFMKSHHTTEKVGEHSAFFHPRNTQKQVFRKFEEIMKGFE